jgi:hypothetical protein
MRRRKRPPLSACLRFCLNDWTVLVHNIPYSLHYVMQEKDKEVYESETALFLAKSLLSPLTQDRKIAPPPLIAAQVHGILQENRSRPGRARTPPRNNPTQNTQSRLQQQAHPSTNQPLPTRSPNSRLRLRRW